MWPYLLVVSAVGIGAWFFKGGSATAAAKGSNNHATGVANLPIGSFVTVRDFPGVAWKISEKHQGILPAGPTPVGGFPPKAVSVWFYTIDRQGFTQQLIIDESAITDTSNTLADI